MISALLALAILSPSAPLQQDKDQPREYRYVRSRQFQLKDLQVEEVKVGAKLEHALKAWVMDTEAKRQEGMMFLMGNDFTEKEAMIFVFKSAQRLDFWMKNTYVPLDIAYLDAEGKIVKTYTMRALDIYSDYASGVPAKYALEMKQGSLVKLGMEIGQKVSIPDKVKAKE